jgi:hypothetical protein
MYRTLAAGALVLGIGKMLRFHARNMAPGSAARDEHWTRHWRRHDGPKHPWFSHHGKWTDEADAAAGSSAAAENDAAAESGPAEVVI